LILLVSEPVVFAQDINDYYIVLDPGHGGSDSGAPGYNGDAWPDEADFNLATASNADIWISDANLGRVVRTRVEDVDVTFEERGRIANGVDADGFGRRVDLDFLLAFVSVHYNANEAPSVRGTSVFSYTDRDTFPPTSEPENDSSTSCEGLIFAGNMIDAVVNETKGDYYRNGEWVFHDAQPFTNDGVWGNNWDIFNYLQYGKDDDFAALLVEFEFITNPDVWVIVEPIGHYYDAYYHARAGRAVKVAWVDYFNYQDPHAFFGTSQACSEARSGSGLRKPALFPEPVSVSISGPGVLGWKERGTWTANPSGCDGPYTYEWRYRYNGTGSWSDVAGTAQSYSRTMLDTDFELQVRVSCPDHQDGYATRYVSYEEGLTSRKPVGDEFVDQGQLVPQEFALRLNYPNPFNPETIILYELPEAAFVALEIYDMAGRKVRDLVRGKRPAGYHRVVWDGKDDSGHPLPSAVYIYRMAAGDFEQTKRMVLIR
jgi:N-acetylmuramoyl-L-alanine amidase